MQAGVKTRIVITDDDENLVKLLSLQLSRSGYSVDSATSADEGYRLALTGDYDLIVLDVIMPKRNGLDVCRALRAKGVITPILVLSGKTDKAIIVECLEAGADDYLTKPFSYKELAARINAMLRRNKKSFDSRFIRHYDIELDTDSHVIRFCDNSLQLTRVEASLLRQLMYAAPEPVSKKILLKEVWDVDYRHTSNRLEVYIKRLRDKLEELSGSSHIITIRGKGYLFGQS